jgi:hypothetical protein
MNHKLKFVHMHIKYFQKLISPELNFKTEKLESSALNKDFLLEIFPSIIGKGVVSSYISTLQLRTKVWQRQLQETRPKISSYLTVLE